MKNSYKNALIMIALILSIVSIVMGIIGSITGVTLNQQQDEILVLPIPSIFRLLMNIVIVTINFIIFRKNKTSKLLAIVTIILVMLLPICNIFWNRYMQVVCMSKGTKTLALYTLIEKSLDLAKVFANIAGLIICAAMGAAIYEGSSNRDRANVWFIISVLLGIASIGISYVVRGEGFRELTGTSADIPTVDRITTYEVFALIIPTIIIAVTILISICSQISKSYIVVVTVLISILQLVYTGVLTFETLFVGFGQSVSDLAAYGMLSGMVSTFAIPVMYMAEVFLMIGLSREYTNKNNAQLEA